MNKSDNSNSNDKFVYKSNNLNCDNLLVYISDNSNIRIAILHSHHSPLFNIVIVKLAMKFYARFPNN